MKKIEAIKRREIGHCQNCPREPELLRYDGQRGERQRPTKRADTTVAGRRVLCGLSAQD